jgi:hypothetical protein
VIHRTSRTARDYHCPSLGSKPMSYSSPFWVALLTVMSLAGGYPIPHAGKLN